MTHPDVPALVRALCSEFGGDPALQHALLRARTVEEVLAAVSDSMDAAAELAQAAATRPQGGDVALANARAATAARQRAVRRIVQGDLDACPEAPPARAPFRVATSGP